MNKRTISIGHIFGIPIGLDRGRCDNQSILWKCGATRGRALCRRHALQDPGAKDHALHLRGDRRNWRRAPTTKAEFWIAIAGPLVSFGLAILFGLLQSVFTTIAPLFAMIRYLALTNGSLAVFNLIPAFPLNGGRIFRATL